MLVPDNLVILHNYSSQHKDATLSIQIKMEFQWVLHTDLCFCITNRWMSLKYSIHECLFQSCVSFFDVLVESKRIWAHKETGTCSSYGVNQLLIVCSHEIPHNPMFGLPYKCKPFLNINWASHRCREKNAHNETSLLSRVTILAMPTIRLKVRTLF